MKYFSKNKANRNYHLAIIGGGPIGLYLAIELARLGQDVEVFEKKDWPVDKVCGQGIMPSGLKALKNIGIEFEHLEDCFLFSSIEYLDGDETIMAKLDGQGIGVLRKILSQKLYDKARFYNNIKLHSNSKIEKIQIETDNKIILYNLQSDRMNAFDFLFVCDGLNSQMRKLLNFSKVRRGLHRMGARLHFKIEPWCDKVQVYWNEGIEAYITPVNKETVEVAFLWYESVLEKGAHLKERLLNKFPKLEKKLSQVRDMNDFKSYGPFKEVSKDIKYGNIFFVGDSYKFLDGITGEGISLGLKSARIISQNYDQFSLLKRLKIKLFYLNYQIWVLLALSLSRHIVWRKFTFRIIQVINWPFRMILKINDL